MKRAKVFYSTTLIREVIVPLSTKKTCDSNRSNIMTPFRAPWTFHSWKSVLYAGKTRDNSGKSLAMLHKPMWPAAMTNVMQTRMLFLNLQHTRQKWSPCGNTSDTGQRETKRMRGLLLSIESINVNTWIWSLQNKVPKRAVYESPFTGSERILDAKNVTWAAKG